MHQSLRGGIVGAPIFEGTYCWCTNLYGRELLVHRSTHFGLVHHRSIPMFLLLRKITSIKAVGAPIYVRGSVLLVHQSTGSGIVGAPIYEPPYCRCTDLSGEVLLVHQSLRGGIVGAPIFEGRYCWCTNL